MFHDFAKMSHKILILYFQFYRDFRKKTTKKLANLGEVNEVKAQLTSWPQYAKVNHQALKS